MNLRGIEFTDHEVATLVIDLVTFVTPEQLLERAAGHRNAATRLPTLAEIHTNLAETFERAAELASLVAAERQRATEEARERLRGGDRG